MKVLDLHCPTGHVFEGWFASEDDFQNQLQRKLVQCPICGAHDVAKRLSAPRLNLGAQPPRPTASPAVSVDSAPQPAPDITSQAREHLQAVQAAWMQWSRKVAANTENVGDRFAEEVRRMHYGEIDERAIRGQASPRQAMELAEEGIGVIPLALPEGGSGKLQ
jgi:hypothetical protein